jgi:hypothetical protein
VCCVVVFDIQSALASPAIPPRPPEACYYKDHSTRTATTMKDRYHCDRPAPPHSKAQPSTPRSLPIAYAATLVSNALVLTTFSRLSASPPQCCKVGRVMRLTYCNPKVNFFPSKSYYTHYSSPCTNHRPYQHPITPPLHDATILPRKYTNLFADEHAPWHVAPPRAMHAPSRPDSPLADRYVTYTNKSHSPCPMPTADTTTPSKSFVPTRAYLIVDPSALHSPPHSPLITHNPP